MILAKSTNVQLVAKEIQDYFNDLTLLAIFATDILLSLVDRLNIPSILKTLIFSTEVIGM